MSPNGQEAWATLPLLPLLLAVFHTIIPVACGQNNVILACKDIDRSVYTAMVVDQERAAAQARSAEIDALLNRHRVSLAQSQKLVESWLPLSKEEQEQKKSKAEEESSSVAQFLRPELYAACRFHLF